MSTSTSAILGLIFLGLANASVFLMFKLWGYPFDKETHKSEAPPALMLLHRLIGYAYAILYVFMMCTWCRVYGTIKSNCHHGLSHT